MSYDDLVQSINKRFPNAVTKNAVQNMNAIPTGCINLDVILGIGGIPEKRITEIYGTESSGKSTLALQCVASCQQMGKDAVYIDAEHSIDSKYATSIGVDMDKLILIQPDSAEDALDIIYFTLKDKTGSNVGLVVLDSIAAMRPRAEADSESGDATVGLHARLLSQGLRKIVPELNHSNAGLILINQQRAQIGGMTSFAGPSKTTPGGYAIKYAASVRLEIARMSNLMSKDETTGIKVKAQTRKNKVAPPFQVTTFDIQFGKGTDLATQVIELATEAGLIVKSGSWYKYNDETIGQGVASAREFVLESGKILEMYDTAIKEVEGLTDFTVEFYRSALKNKYGKT